MAKSVTEQVASIFKLRGSNPEKMLFTLMLMTAVLVTVDRLDKGEAPRPRNFIAWFAVYLVLAFAAEFGQEPARLAVAIAAVSLLTFAVRKRSSILSIARKLSKASGGPEAPTELTGFTDYGSSTPLGNYVTVFGEVAGA